MSLNILVEVNPKHAVSRKNVAAEVVPASVKASPVAIVPATMRSTRGGTRVTKSAAVSKPKIDGPQNEPTTVPARAAGTPMRPSHVGAHKRNDPWPMRYAHSAAPQSAAHTSAEGEDCRGASLTATSRSPIIAAGNRMRCAAMRTAVETAAAAT